VTEVTGDYGELCRWDDEDQQEEGQRGERTLDEEDTRDYCLRKR